MFLLCLNTHVVLYDNMKKKVFQSFLLQVIYGYISRYLFKPFINIRFCDDKIFKNISQFIIVANHSSHLDTVSLLATLPRRTLWKMKPVAAEDYFGKTKFRTWLSNYFINTLLIQRKATKCEKNNPVAKMLKALDDGYCLILYPEGTRKHKGEMKEIKPGIAHILSARPNIPYIPVYLEGMKFELLKKNYKSITYGNISYAKSSNVKEILSQIIADFEQFQNKI